MASGGSIQFDIKFNVDQGALKQAQSSLQQLAQMSEKEFKTINPTIDSSSAIKSMSQLREMAASTQDALKAAFDPSSGKFDLSAFNNSLALAGHSMSDLSNLVTAGGAKGAAAFSAMQASLASARSQITTASSAMDKLSASFERAMLNFATQKIFTSMVSGINQAISYVEELDSNLNNIQLVTGKNKTQMDQFAKSANEAAKALGTTTTNYVKGSQTYYQQGLSDEQVKARNEITIKAANVMQQDADNVASYLTAVWNGFGATTENAEKYVDKLAAVGAKSASNMESIATAMSKVASTANLLGVNVDQLSAQIATIIDVTQQAPESVGTALKTIYARMTDLTLGKTDEDGVGLGTVSSALQNYGIQILDASGEKIRNVGDIFSEIAAKWDTWTNAQQTAIAQQIGGKRQYTYMETLFQNWDKYSSLESVSQNADGTLNKQNDVYMESTTAHLNELKSAWQGLYTEMLNAEGINAVADTFKTLAEALTEVASAAGGVKGIWTSLGAILGGKAVGSLAGSAISGVSTFLSNRKYNKELDNLLKENQQRANEKLANYTGNDAAVEAYKKYSSKLSVYSPNYAEQQSELSNMMSSIDGQSTALSGLNSIVQEYNSTIANGANSQTEFANASDVTAASVEEFTNKLKAQAEALANQQKGVESAATALQGINVSGGTPTNQATQAADWRNTLRADTGTMSAIQSTLTGSDLARFNQLMAQPLNNGNVSSFISEMSGYLDTVNTKLGEQSELTEEEKQKFNELADKVREFGSNIDQSSAKLESMSARTAAVAQNVQKFITSVGGAASGINMLNNSMNSFVHTGMSLGTIATGFMSISMAITGVIGVMSSLVATISSIGGTAMTASGVMAGALGGPITAAAIGVIAIIGGISYAIQKATKNMEDFQQQAAATAKFTQTRNNEVIKKDNSNLQTIQEFQDLYATYQQTGEVTDELKAKTEELFDLYPGKIQYLDLIAGRYEKIAEAAADAAQQESDEALKNSEANSDSQESLLATGITTAGSGGRSKFINDTTYLQTGENSGQYYTKNLNGSINTTAPTTDYSHVLSAQTGQTLTAESGALARTIQEAIQTYGISDDIIDGYKDAIGKEIDTELANNTITFGDDVAQAASLREYETNKRVLDRIQKNYNKKQDMYTPTAFTPTSSMYLDENTAIENELTTNVRYRDQYRDYTRQLEPKPVITDYQDDAGFYLGDLEVRKPQTAQEQYQAAYSAWESDNDQIKQKIDGLRAAAASQFFTTYTASNGETLTAPQGQIITNDYIQEYEDYLKSEEQRRQAIAAQNAKYVSMEAKIESTLGSAIDTSNMTSASTGFKTFNVGQRKKDTTVDTAKAFQELAKEAGLDLEVDKDGNYGFVLSGNEANQQDQLIKAFQLLYENKDSEKYSGLFDYDSIMSQTVKDSDGNDTELQTVYESLLEQYKAEINQFKTAINTQLSNNIFNNDVYTRQLKGEKLSVDDITAIEDMEDEAIQTIATNLEGRSSYVQNAVAQAYGYDDYASMQEDVKNLDKIAGTHLKNSKAKKMVGAQIGKSASGALQEVTNVSNALEELSNGSEDVKQQVITKLQELVTWINDANIDMSDVLAVLAGKGISADQLSYLSSEALHGAYNSGKATQRYSSIQGALGYSSNIGSGKFYGMSDKAAAAFTSAMTPDQLEEWTKNYQWSQDETANKSWGRELLNQWIKEYNPIENARADYNSAIQVKGETINHLFQDSGFQKIIGNKNFTDLSTILTSENNNKNLIDSILASKDFEKYANQQTTTDLPSEDRWNNLTKEAQAQEFLAKTAQVTEDEFKQLSSIMTDYQKSIADGKSKEEALNEAIKKNKDARQDVVQALINYCDTIKEVSDSEATEEEKMAAIKSMLPGIQEQLGITAADWQQLVDAIKSTKDPNIDDSKIEELAESAAIAATNIRDIGKAAAEVKDIDFSHLGLGSEESSKANAYKQSILKSAGIIDASTLTTAAANFSVADMGSLQQKAQEASRGGSFDDYANALGTALYNALINSGFAEEEAQKYKSQLTGDSNREGLVSGFQQDYGFSSVAAMRQSLGDKWVEKYFTQSGGLADTLAKNASTTQQDVWDYLLKNNKLSNTGLTQDQLTKMSTATGRGELLDSTEITDEIKQQIENAYQSRINELIQGAAEQNLLATNGNSAMFPKNAATGQFDANQMTDEGRNQIRNLVTQMTNGKVDGTQITDAACDAIAAAISQLFGGGGISTEAILQAIKDAVKEVMAGTPSATQAEGINPQEDVSGQAESADENYYEGNTGKEGATVEDNKTVTRQKAGNSLLANGDQWVKDLNSGDIATRTAAQQNLIQAVSTLYSDTAGAKDLDFSSMTAGGWGEYMANLHHNATASNLDSYRSMLGGTLSQSAFEQLNTYQLANVDTSKLLPEEVDAYYGAARNAEYQNALTKGASEEQARRIYDTSTYSNKSVRANLENDKFLDIFDDFYKEFEGKSQREIIGSLREKQTEASARGDTETLEAAQQYETDALAGKISNSSGESRLLDAESLEDLAKWAGTDTQSIRELGDEIYAASDNLQQFGEQEGKLAAQEEAARQIRAEAGWAEIAKDSKMDDAIQKIEKYQKATDKATDSTQSADRATKNNKVTYNDYRSAVDQVAAHLEKVLDVSGDFAKALAKQPGVAKATKKALDGTNKSWDNFKNVTKAARTEALKISTLPKIADALGIDEAGDQFKDVQSGLDSIESAWNDLCGQEWTPESQASWINETTAGLSSINSMLAQMGPAGEASANAIAESLNQAYGEGTFESTPVPVGTDPSTTSDPFLQLKGDGNDVTVTADGLVGRLFSSLGVPLSGNITADGNTQVDATSSQAQFYIVHATGKQPNVNSPKPTGGNKGGGGGGGGNQAKKHDKKRRTQEIDPYHKVHRVIESLKTNIEDFEKLDEKITGNKRIEALKTELELLTDQVAEESKLLEIAEKEQRLAQTELKSGEDFSESGYFDNLKGYVKTDEYGNITNFVELREKALEDYNKAADVEMEDEEWEKVEDDYDHFTEWLDWYEEASDEVQQAHSDLVDSWNDATEKQIDAFKESVDAAKDWDDARQSYIDFLSEIVDYKDVITNWDSEAFSSAMNAFNNMFSNENTHILDEDAKIVGQIMQDLTSIANGQSGTIYGIDSEQAISDLKDYLEEMESQMQTIKTSYDDLKTAYNDSFSEMDEDIQTVITDLEAENQVIQHQISLVQTLKGEDAYSALITLYEQQFANEENQLTTLKTAADTWKAYLESIDENEYPEVYKTVKEAYEQAIEDLDSTLETHLETIASKYTNAIANVYDNITKSLESAGGTDLDGLDKEWELLTQHTEDYFDTIQKVYEIEKLRTLMQKDIDDLENNLTAQGKLTDVMKEQLEILESREELTQYDVDRAQKIFDLTKAQLELEDLQDDKTTMRLRRDAAGNYSYVYTTDDDAIEEAKNKVIELQEQLYTFDKERLQTTLKEAADAYNTYITDVQEVMNDTTLSSEEREAKLAQLLDDYHETIKDAQRDTGIAYDNFVDDINAATDSTAQVYKTFLESMNDETINALDQINSDTENYITDIFGGYYNVWKSLRGTEDNWSENSLSDLLDAADTQAKVLAAERDAAEDAALATYNTSNDDIATIDNATEDINTTITNSTEVINNIADKMAQGLEIWNSMNNYLQIISNAYNYLANQYATIEGAEYTDEVLSTLANQTYTSTDDLTGATSTKSVWAGTVLEGVTVDTSQSILSLQNDTLTSIENVIKTIASAVGVNDSALQQFDTGGYTGEFGSNGRLAILDSKELVLNANDTKNFLNGLNIMDTLMSEYQDLVNSKISSINAVAANNNNYIPANTEVDQTVQIDATFPAVTDHTQVEDALKNLINIASQKANKNSRI